MNTNEQAPECCPFCGAAMMGTRSTDGEYARYKCGNAFDVQNKLERGFQSEACATAERERLTRERDEALQLAQRAVQKSCDMAFQAGQAEGQLVGAIARVKQLESEWAGWPDLQREWFGDKYATMQPWDAVRARIEDTEARVKRLEEAGDAIVDHNIGCGCGQDGPCRACRMACQAWTQAKEAKP